MTNKRYCINNHDTYVVGRKKNNTCKECERERNRKENMTEEQILKIKQRKARWWIKYLENRTEEQKERDRKNHRKTDDKRMADPIRRMKVNTKLRIKRLEKGK